MTAPRASRAAAKAPQTPAVDAPEATEPDVTGEATEPTAPPAIVDEERPPTSVLTPSELLSLPPRLAEDAKTFTLPDGRVMSGDEYAARLEHLSSPFPASWIERLPKQVRKDDMDKGKCDGSRKYSADGFACGGWHAQSVHLDYIGHAGITMRLTEVDPWWRWDATVTNPDGSPRVDAEGFWMTLTVLGITQVGFGDASGKRGANAVKEAIGDGIRNAAMRFGVGTYLWSKSEHAALLKTEGASEPGPAQRSNDEPTAPRRPLPDAAVVEAELADALEQADPLAAVIAVGNKYGDVVLRQVPCQLQGQPANLEQAVLSLIQRVQAQRAGARTPSPADAQGGAHDERAPERAPEQAPAQEDPAERSDRAVRALAEAERQSRSRSTSNSAEDLLRARLESEIAGQADVLGIHPRQYIAEYLADSGAASSKDVAPLALRAWVFSQRPAIIEALVVQGRATEAEAYERARSEKAVSTWEQLTASSMSAHEEPANV